MTNMNYRCVNGKWAINKSGCYFSIEGDNQLSEFEAVIRDIRNGKKKFYSEDGRKTILPENIKLKPTGFIAICQCDRIVGALDYINIDRKESGKILGSWLHNGCDIKCMYVGSWNVTVLPCICKEDSCVTIY